LLETLSSDEFKKKDFNFFWKWKKSCGSINFFWKWKKSAEHSEAEHQFFLEMEKISGT